MEALARHDTSSETYEGAENLPDERGVERMNNNYDARLWNLLEKRKLADLSQFHQQGFFDEVPLYSRKSDVDFLPDDESANEVLLGFALKFLKSVVAYEQHREGYFAAITIWDFSEDRLVPNIFVWCHAVQGLEKKLALVPVTSSFGKRTKKLVSKLRLGDQFSVLEDTLTEPGTKRVFIAPMVQPYQGFVLLDHFRNQALISK
jgi:hypothetical protein